MKRPEMLDGTLAGDFGFDPLGIANSAERLSFMADSEIKHARLAMLCAAGWPLAELWHNGLASAVGLEPQLAPGGRAPSVLNGALLDRPTGLAGLALLIGVGVAIELSTFALGFGEAQKKQDAYNAKLPGELGFDPLGLVRGYGESEQAQKAMRTAELKNGRTAMVAVLMYVIEEVTTGKPVTQLTPFIFKPFWQIVVEAMGASPMGGDGYDAYLRASEADDAAAAVAEPAAAAAEPAAAVAEPAAAAAAVAPIAATMTDAAAAVAPVADAVPAPVADAAAAAATYSRPSLPRRSISPAPRRKRRPPRPRLYEGHNVLDDQRRGARHDAGVGLLFEGGFVVIGRPAPAAAGSSSTTAAPIEGERFRPRAALVARGRQLERGVGDLLPQQRVELRADADDELLGAPRHAESDPLVDREHAVRAVRLDELPQRAAEEHERERRRGRAVAQVDRVVLSFSA